MNKAELSDISSEGSVVATLIYHPEFIAHSEYLKPDYFSVSLNACFYWAIQSLYEKGITNIDFYNLANEIKSEANKYDEIKKYDLATLSERIELLKTIARETIEEYQEAVDKVVTFAFKRDLIDVLGKINKDCYRPNFTLEKLNHYVYSELDRLTESYITDESIEILGEKIDDIWAEIINRRANDGTYGIPSKFNSFSNYFTYEPGELVTIQAKSKQGKSVFLMNEAVHKLKNGLSVLVIDREMTTRLYTERLLSNLTGIEINRVKSGKYNDREADEIQKAIDWIKKQSFVHIYAPDLSMERLYSICKVLQHKINLGFVVYDYLKSNETSASDNYNALGSKCDFLKNNIAGKLNIPVLAACQLNRSGEVADSAKINMFTSVAIKWGYKTQSMIAKDGTRSGNAYAKIYKNRLGQQMQEDDNDDYLDFSFSGATMTIAEAEPHSSY